MMIDRITTIMEHQGRQVSFLCFCMEKLCDKINHIARSVGEPNGRVTFGGCVELPADAARRAFEGQGQHAEAEAVRMEYEFSQNLYLSILPENNEGLRQAIEEAPLRELKKAFESYRTLNELTEEAKKRSEEVEEQAKTMADALNVNVRQLVAEATKEQTIKMAAESKKIEEDRKKIDAAMRRIDASLKEVEALRAEASNVVVASKPAVRSIATIKS